MCFVSLALTIPEVERISRLHVGPIFGSDAGSNLDNGDTSGTIIKEGTNRCVS
jgi:hypothetical protein